MSDITIQQFNPASKCWNTIHKMDSSEYNAETFIPINKYGGPYRVFGLEEPKKVLDFYKEDVVESFELEKENDGNVEEEEPKSKSATKKSKKYDDEWK